MIRTFAAFDISELFQLASIFIFKHFLTSKASTMATDNRENFVINLAGDVMIG